MNLVQRALVSSLNSVQSSWTAQFTELQNLVQEKLSSLNLVDRFSEPAIDGELGSWTTEPTSKTVLELVLLIEPSSRTDHCFLNLVHELVCENWTQF